MKKIVEIFQETEESPFEIRLKERGPKYVAHDVGKGFFIHKVGGSMERGYWVNTDKEVIEDD